MVLCQVAQMFEKRKPMRYSARSAERSKGNKVVIGCGLALFV